MEKTSMVFAPLIKNKSKIIKFMRELLDSGILTMTENDKKFFMIAQGSHGLYKQQTSFKNIPIKDDRYDLYYGKDFPHKKIMDFFKEESDNLMILHGIPGSGKSNYIKNLITQSKEDVIYVPPSMIGVISDPSFVSFMLENKNNILIIEDAEQILSNERNSATNNLLGLTDGFLKDSLKLKIITTLNADISTIDKALLRKGRLHLSHNFEKLSADEANELAKFCDIDHEFDEDIALCDIFNFDKFNSPLKDNERSMGFGNF
jgi:SpoVK/Ycf46/Vps4 family AAA+-type ATPase